MAGVRPDLHTPCDPPKDSLHGARPNANKPDAENDPAPGGSPERGPITLSRRIDSLPANPTSPYAMTEPVRPAAPRNHEQVLLIRQGLNLLRTCQRRSCL